MTILNLDEIERRLRTTTRLDADDRAWAREVIRQLDGVAAAEATDGQSADYVRGALASALNAARAYEQSERGKRHLDSVTAIRGHLHRMPDEFRSAQPSEDRARADMAEAQKSAWLDKKDGN